MTADIKKTEIKSTLKEITLQCMYIYIPVAYSQKLLGCVVFNVYVECY